jgi:uncharacterized sulfatase
MYQPKQREELYHLRSDPFELENLAASPEQSEVLNTMRGRLAGWITETRDTGFLNESEVLLRAADTTPYEMAQDPARYDLPRILQAAERVGDPEAVDEAVVGLSDADSGVRYWSALAVQAAKKEGVPGEAVIALKRGLADSSPIVSIASAETLCIVASTCERPRTVLLNRLRDEPSWLALQAAISLRRLGDEACPIQHEVEEVLGEHLGSAGGRYKNWMNSMFIGFALDQVLLTCGAIGENPLND